MSVELQNYLTVADFDKFIEALYNLNFNRAPMSAKSFEILYSCAFFCCLRISEALNLREDDFNFDRKIVTIRQGKTGKNQKTSIAPPFIEPLRRFADTKIGRALFSCSRQTAWRYSKDIGKAAGLNVFDIVGKGKEIEGVYTHLFRKSYAKFMEEKGASPSLINLKGRWKPKDQYQTYTKPSLISLINWEAKAWSKE